MGLKERIKRCESIVNSGDNLRFTIGVFADIEKNYIYSGSNFNKDYINKLFEPLPMYCGIKGISTVNTLGELQKLCDKHNWNINVFPLTEINTNWKEEMEQLWENETIETM